MIPGPNQDVIPTPDTQASSWMNNFATLWVPATWNAVTPTSASLLFTQATFAVALANATNASTRSTPTIAAKNEARAAAEILFRDAVRSAVAQWRTVEATTGNPPTAALNELGVRTPKTTRTPILEPTDAPILAFASTRPGTASVRLTQTINGLPVTARKFPAGITTLRLSIAAPTGDPAVLTLRRVNVTIPTTAYTTGTILTVTGQYVTARGLAGPLSPPIQMPVAN